MRSALLVRAARWSAQLPQPLIAASLAETRSARTLPESRSDPVMNPFAEHRLRRAISQLLQGKDEARYLHEATGRLFAICAEDDGRYFVSEFLPNDPEILDLIRADPNATQQIRDQRGVDRESLAFFAGGYGLGTIYHPGLDAAVDAIVDAIDSNVVLKDCLTPEERAEQLGPKGLAREAVAEAEASVAYWQDQARRPGSQGSILDGAKSMLGPLGDDAKKRILSFLNDPSVATWDDCCSLIVDGRRTLWQLWTDHDETAPRAVADGEWPRIPSPDQVLGWLQAAPGERQEEIHEHLRQAQDRLESARQRLEGVSVPSEDPDPLAGPGMG